MAVPVGAKARQEAVDDEVPSNRSGNPTFASILERRFSRRTFLRGAAGGAAVLTVGRAVPGFARSAAAAAAPGALTFSAISLSNADRVIVADGYVAPLLIAWGDPLFPGVPAVDPNRQTADLQSRQFGYNADGLWFFPLPMGSRNGNSGILSVNHEYTDNALMFLGYDVRAQTREQVDVQIAAHGLTFVEVTRDAAGRWSYELGSGYNRRITGETEMLLTGPAAGHELLKSGYDPSGTRVRGTLNNCAAGGTPWGTILTCEENFNQYFGNLDILTDEDPRKAMHRRYGLPTGGSERLWERHHDRFDMGKEPNEPFRFGWVVEIDPYDPTFVPRKRTALGRFKHEAATIKLSADNRVAAYMGDDERFEYIYKFVSGGRYNAANRAANIGLLDEGTLYVAKFNANGAGEWMPLVQGQGPLTAANGFRSQADVLVNTRRAADLLGATKMDRPEDMEPNPVNGRIYAVMTIQRAPHRRADRPSEPTSREPARSHHRDHRGR